METPLPDPAWRLFLGIWPPPAVRAEIERAADAWAWPATARRTRAERLHATLHFIGNVPQSRVAQVQNALRVPWKGGATLSLDRAEVWPGGVAVLEALHVPAALAELHAGLAEGLVDLALPVETRGWRPHVTLARKAQGAQPGALTPIAWRLEASYALVRSLPGGAGYAPVQVFD
jgi:2'-5' RNA ligase